MERQDILQFHKFKILKACKVWVQEKCPYEDEDCWVFHQDLTCPHTISFTMIANTAVLAISHLQPMNKTSLNYPKKDKIIFVQTQQINESTNIVQQKEHELQILHSKRLSVNQRWKVWQLQNKGAMHLLPSAMKHHLQG